MQLKCEHASCETPYCPACGKPINTTERPAEQLLAYLTAQAERAKDRIEDADDPRHDRYSPPAGHNSIAEWRVSEKASATRSAVKWIAWRDALKKLMNGVAK